MTDISLIRSTVLFVRKRDWKEKKSGFTAVHLGLLYMETWEKRCISNLKPITYIRELNQLVSELTSYTPRGTCYTNILIIIMDTPMSL